MKLARVNTTLNDSVKRILIASKQLDLLLNSFNSLAKKNNVIVHKKYKDQNYEFLLDPRIFNYLITRVLNFIYHDFGNTRFEAELDVNLDKDGLAVLSVIFSLPNPRNIVRLTEDIKDIKSFIDKNKPDKISRLNILHGTLKILSNYLDFSFKVENKNNKINFIVNFNKLKVLEDA